MQRHHLHPGTRSLALLDAVLELHARRVIDCSFSAQPDAQLIIKALYRPASNEVMHHYGCIRPHQFNEGLLPAVTEEITCCPGLVDHYNSGSREQEVVKLRWDWEIPIPEFNASVFLIPADFGGLHESSGIKNGDEQLVVLNNVAKSVIEWQRGLDPVWVFPYGQPDRNGKATPVHRMNDSAWKKARVRAAKKFQECFLRPAPAGFASIRAHDLKHTFGRRLRAAGVTEEVRKALLGHKNGSITSHYSAAELGKLIDEANRNSATDSRGPALTI